MIPFSPIRTLDSPLPVAEAAARLDEGLRGRRKLLGPPRVVRGRVHDDRLWLVAGRRGVANAWRPVLRGRLAGTEGGSRLVYRFGWNPLVEVFTALWFGALVLFLVVGLIRTAIGAASGVPTGAHDLLALIGVTVGMMALGAAIVGGATWVGRTEARTVTTWLAERLETNTE
ncbi:hypothetical protein [Dactylosporangium sp. CS-033363]|uniref:hypothetical protein n=1 Tax=Dactylosporangium sp. CS-033363 TaxID=3239935 RepID=UPI003D90D364